VSATCGRGRALALVPDKAVDRQPAGPAKTLTQRKFFAVDVSLPQNAAAAPD